MRFLEFVQWLGVTLTPGQSVLAAVAFDGVDPCDLAAPERAMARELFGDVERFTPAVRAVVAIVAGARGGKSYIASLRGLHLALTVPLKALAPGEVAAGVVVAPDQRLARQCARYVQGAVEARRELGSLVVGQTQDGITLRRPDGATVEIVCLPATEAGRSLRGRTLAFAVFDESAFFKSDEYAVADADLYRAVSPRVVPGGQVILVSTPWGEQGLLFELWRDNWGKPATAVVAHAPTLLLRDDEHTRAVVTREELRDPANARREFGAEFGSTDESLLDAQDVERCVDKGRVENQRDQGTRYAMAVDLATRHDFSVVLVAHRELQKRDGAPPVDVIVIDLARHWAPVRVGKLLKARVEPDVLESEVAAVANHFRCAVNADSWSFDFFESRMKARGIKVEQMPMHASEQAKRAATLATYIRQGRVRLVDDNPELLKQLKGLRVTRHAGGRLSFAAANRKGQHDDYPKALLLLIEQAIKLPASGGNIHSEWAKDGTRNWYAVDAIGNRTPSLPPVGSRDWLDLALQCRRSGIQVAELTEWLREPANAEAVERHGERQAGYGSLASLGYR